MRKKLWKWPLITLAAVLAFALMIVATDFSDSIYAGEFSKTLSSVFNSNRLIKFWRSFNKPLRSSDARMNLSGSDELISGVKIFKEDKLLYRSFQQLRRIHNTPPILSAVYGNKKTISSYDEGILKSNANPGVSLLKSEKEPPLLKSRGPQMENIDPFHAPFSWEPTFVTSDSELYSIFTAADLGIHPYNNPPDPASEPEPADGETGTALNLILMWTGYDPDDDQLWYDIRFGTTSPPPLVVEDHSDDWWEIPYTLDENQTYYWRIDSKDYEFTTPGDVWNFTTGYDATPTSPPQPTATPTPGPRSIDIFCNQPIYQAGDLFHLWTFINNPAPGLEVDEYILLDVWGEYWFWPSWTQEMDYVNRVLEPWTTYEETILEFEWPSGAGEAYGIVFWAAIFHAGTFDFAGDYGMCSFGWE